MPQSSSSIIHWLLGSAFIVCASILPGCAQWGGQVLEDNHVAYNTSVAQAMDRQMLLNIVRMSKDKPRSG